MAKKERKNKSSNKDNDLAVVDAELVPMGTHDLLIQKAIESNADLDRLEKLMDLKERHEKNEAKKAYNAAMVAFKKENITILKTATVDFTNKAGVRTKYNHAELGEIVNKITEKLADHGLFHSWIPEQTKINEIKVTCRITHNAGHSESVSMMAGPDATGGKNPIQQISSSKSYLERYTLGSILGLAASEDDDGRGGGQNGNTSSEDEFISESKFNDFFGKWEKIIQNGKQSPDELLEFVKGKGIILAPAHIELIKKVEVTWK